MFPIAANAAMGDLLGIDPVSGCLIFLNFVSMFANEQKQLSQGEAPTETSCSQLVPAHVPINALAREEMYRLFLRKSCEPHSAIFARSITYRTKKGNYLDADTRKQVSLVFIFEGISVKTISNR